MPAYFISEPWLNLWIADTPLHYDSAYGPDVSLRLAYNFRHTASTVSLSQWQGARFGNYEGMVGAWACSWLSFAELDSSENSVDVLLPAGGWATFTFPSGSSVSTMSYKHNLTLEKTGSLGAVSSLTLRYPDGSQALYGVHDTNAPGLVAYAGLYYVSAVSDASGKQTTFSYDGDFQLTTVTAADGATFTLNYDDAVLPAYVTSVETSYGPTVSFEYEHLFGQPIGMLTNITDAAGISSGFGYDIGFVWDLTRLTTPYGTTYFDTGGAANEYPGGL